MGVKKMEDKAKGGNTESVIKWKKEKRAAVELIFVTPFHFINSLPMS